MDTVKSTGQSIHISDEVLREVAALAAQDVEGVDRLVGRRGFRTPPAQTVRIRNMGGAISVGVRVVIRGGSRAADVAKQVQQAVKRGIQDMTGVTAVYVDVEISGMESDV